MLKILKKLYIMNMFPKSAHVVTFDYNILNDFLLIIFIQRMYFQTPKMPKQNSIFIH